MTWGDPSGSKGGRAQHFQTNKRQVCAPSDPCSALCAAAPRPHGIHSYELGVVAPGSVRGAALRGRTAPASPHKLNGFPTGLAISFTAQRGARRLGAQQRHRDGGRVPSPRLGALGRIAGARTQTRHAPTRLPDCWPHLCFARGPRAALRCSTRASPRQARLPLPRVRVGECGCPAAQRTSSLSHEPLLQWVCE